MGTPVVDLDAKAASLAKVDGSAALEDKTLIAAAVQERALETSTATSATGLKFFEAFSVLAALPVAVNAGTHSASSQR